MHRKVKRNSKLYQLKQWTKPHNTFFSPQMEQTQYLGKRGLINAKEKQKQKLVAKNEECLVRYVGSSRLKGYHRRLLAVHKELDEDSMKKPEVFSP